MVQLFLWLGRTEGVSLLLLFFVAMPLKYLAGEPQAVRIVGMAHGILFLLYAYMIFHVATEKKWPLKHILWCLVLSCLPFGTFYFEKKYAHLYSPS